MYKGRDRNAPCWCGSGKKLKRCHLDREEEPPAHLGDLHKALRNAHARVCLSPLGDPCNAVIKAHSVQRARLAEIADRGHVLQLQPVPGSWQLVPKSIGINEASTFTGFCGKHDDRIFAPIEKVDPAPDKQTAFLLTYRAISHEVHAKRSVQRLEPNFRKLDRGQPFHAQRSIQDNATHLFDGVRHGRSDMELAKAAFDSALIGDDLGRFCFARVEFAGRSPFLTCGATSTEYDFRGRLLQNPRTRLESLDVLGISVVNIGGRGIAFLGWMEEHKTAEALTRSLFETREDSRLPAAILQLALEHCENVFISPKWWSSLPETTKAAAISHAGSTIDHERRSNCLHEENLEVPGLTTLSTHLDIGSEL